MAALYFYKNSSNTIFDYQQRIQEGMQWLNVSQDIDTLDGHLLTSIYCQFESFLNSLDLCLMYMRSLNRLETQGIFQEKKPPFKWAEMHQTLLIVAKRALFYCSEQEFLRFAKTARKLDLFFRGSVAKLSCLYECMQERKVIHAYQKPPLPPKTCWKNPRQWNPEDWPRGHYASWDFCFWDIFDEIHKKSSFTLNPKTGIAPYVTIKQRSAEGKWGSILKTLLSPNIPKTLELQPGTFTWLSSDEQQATQQVMRLIFTMTMDPLEVFVDFSRYSASKLPEWRMGATSPYYVPLLEFAFQCGTESIIRALLESFVSNNGQSIADYYDSSSEDISIVSRVLMNRTFPSAIIPLLEEAEKDPNGRLAIRLFQSHHLKTDGSCSLPVIGRIYESSDWWEHPDNILLRACVSGDLRLAMYLVEQEEEKARLCCPPNTPKKDVFMLAAIAASRCVNRRGVFGAPKGSPVEIATRHGHLHVAKFLCEKGADISLELRVEAVQQVAGQVADTVDRWGQAQEDIKKGLGDIGIQMDLSLQQVSRLASYTMAYRDLLGKQKEEVESIKDKIGSNLEIIEKMHSMLDAWESSSRDVCSFFMKHPTVLEDPDQYSMQDIVSLYLSHQQQTKGFYGEQNQFDPTSSTVFQSI